MADITTMTRVKKVVVGTPVRRVTSAVSVNTLSDVDTSSLEDGSTLVWSTGTEKWVATVDLDNQNMDGGSF